MEVIGTGRADEASGRTAFAAELRSALIRRGLPLERVRHHLAQRGISVSTATLSHWQRGSRRPEHPQSLLAVEALESLLALPADSLMSRLPPRRLRGRSASRLQDLAASQRVYGIGSVQEKALGAAFEHFNEDLVVLTSREVVRLDARGCVRQIRGTQVLRAVRDGADHYTFLHRVDTGAASVEVRVRCGTLVAMRFDRNLNYVVADVMFGRTLRSNETVIVDYEVEIGDCGRPSTFHERFTRTRLREYLLHVYFHPEAVPESCQTYYRPGRAMELQQRSTIVPDTSHSVFLLPARCLPGIHGIGWKWRGSSAGRAVRSLRC
ncbi:hypothetical protein ACWDZ5_04805 [Streptomyces sp. NPDC002996]